MTFESLSEIDWELVIFDCDGVLVDSEEISNTIIAELVSGLGIPCTPKQAQRKYMHKTNDEIRDLVEEELGIKINGSFQEMYLERAFKVWERDLFPIPGVLTVLNEITVPVCTASNSSMVELETKLHLTGLLPWFTGRLFSAAAIGKPKPAPDIFELAAKTLGADPSRCLVVEDGAHGIAGAKAAGMHVVGLAATSTASFSGLEATGAPVMTDMKQLLPLVHS